VAEGINSASCGISFGYEWILNRLQSNIDGSHACSVDDLALVTAVLRKDRKATAELVETYADTVYAYVRRRMAPRYDLVDDLVQDTFLAAWEHLRNFRGSSSLRGWMLGIARHKVEDHYRSQLRVAQLDVEPIEELAAPIDIEAIADVERTEQRARKVLEDLPAHYSVALQRRYWERRSTREMAQATGRTEKAVERLLARARKQFRMRWLND
jgi:RNA polymerase sigma-70 factor (ECF subfamily)